MLWLVLMFLQFANCFSRLDLWTRLKFARRRLILKNLYNSIKNRKIINNKLIFFVGKISYYLFLNKFSFFIYLLELTLECL